MEKYKYLDRVKNLLGVTGSYQDDTINEYVNEVKEFITSSGVSLTIAESEKVVGLIARGVSDLWNLGSGGANLSPYFYQRLTQLCYEVKKAEVQENVQT